MCQVMDYSVMYQALAVRLVEYPVVAMVLYSVVIRELGYPSGLVG